MLLNVLSTWGRPRAAQALRQTFCRSLSTSRDSTTTGDDVCSKLPMPPMQSQNAKTPKLAPPAQTAAAPSKNNAEAHASSAAENNGSINRYTNKLPQLRPDYLAEAPTDLEKGVFAGYREGRKLGGGSWGQVHEGTRIDQDPAAPTQVALKCTTLGQSCSAASTIAAEVLALTNIPARPSIVGLYGVLATRLPMHAEEVRLLLQLLPDGAVAHRINRCMYQGEMLPKEEAYQYALDLLDAIAHTHEHGYLHLDIKTHNLLREGVHAVLADFGLARRYGGEVPPRGPAGTRHFRAPEAEYHGRELTPASDMYSAGVTICVILTNRMPMGTGPYAAPFALTKDPIGDLIAECFHANPAERPTARQLRDRIAARLGMA